MRRTASLLLLIGLAASGGCCRFYDRWCGDRGFYRDRCCDPCCYGDRTRRPATVAPRDPLPPPAGDPCGCYDPPPRR